MGNPVAFFSPEPGTRGLAALLALTVVAAGLLAARGLFAVAILAKFGSGEPSQSAIDAVTAIVTGVGLALLFAAAIAAFALAV